MSGFRGWIDTEFYKKLKIEAIKNNMGVAEFTKELAKTDENFQRFIKKQKDDRKKFRFNI